MKKPSLSTQFSLISLAVEKEVFALNEKGEYALSTKEVATIYGCLNEYLFCLAVNAEFIIQTPNNKWMRRVTKPENIGNMFLEGWDIVSPVEFIQEYLKTFWTGITYYSCDAIRRIRKYLASKGLWKLENRNYWQEEAKRRERRPNPLIDPSVVRMVLWAYHCEARLLADGFEFNAVKLVDSTNEEGDVTPIAVRDEERSLPKHCAYTVVDIYNKAFKGICPKWRRIGEVDNTGRRFFDDEESESEEINPIVAAAIEREYDKLTEDKDSDDNDYLVPVPVPLVVNKEVTREEWEKAKEVEETEDEELELPVAAIAVSGKPKPKPKLKNTSIIIPNYAWHPSDAAVGWWENIRQTASWLFVHAPDWLLDGMIPF